MAKKPASPPTQPSPSSSLSLSSEEAEDSSSDEEQTNDTKPDPQKTLTKKQESESESESEVWGKEEEEEDGFEVESLNGDSSGVTVNKGKSLKREFPFLRDALGGNRIVLEKLEKVDVEKAAVLEKKFKKLKFEEINLIRKAYKMVCEEVERGFWKIRFEVVSSSFEEKGIFFFG